jgi:hypothetical protein
VHPQLQQEEKSRRKTLHKLSHKKFRREKMRIFLALTLSLSTALYPQQPAPQSNPQTLPSATQTPTPIYAPQDPLPHTPNSNATLNSSSPAAGDVTLPVGTRIQLYLTNPLYSRTAQVGDVVHAEVAFPVVIANQLAIPRGAFAQGHVTRVVHAGLAHHARIEMQFTTIIFENGYQLPLNGATATASNQSFPDATREIIANAFDTFDSQTSTASALATASPASPQPVSRIMPPLATLELLAFQFPVNPPPPTLPPQKPLPGHGAVEGLAIAGGVAIAAIAIITVAHRGGEIYADYGWQLEMTLQSSVTLNAAEANAPIPDPQ